MYHNDRLETQQEGGRERDRERERERKREREGEITNKLESNRQIQR